MIRAILTDIEGTTSSIRFVKEVLFPYAAEQMGDFLARHWDDPAVVEQVAAARRDSGENLATPEQAAALIDEAGSVANIWFFDNLIQGARYKAREAVFKPLLQRDRDRQAGTRRPRRPEIDEWIDRQPP